MIKNNIMFSKCIYQIPELKKVLKYIDEYNTYESFDFCIEH